MSNYNIANRYAVALMALAEDKKIVQQVSKDVELIYLALKNSKELRAALASPVIKQEMKDKVLSEVFKSKISHDSMNFIKFVVEKNREDMLYQISGRFLEVLDIKQGIVNAEVSSSNELLDTQKTKIKDKLENLTGKKVRLTFSLDNRLIGGFLIKIDDTVIDASIKRQLELLKESFKSGGVDLN